MLFVSINFFTGKGGLFEFIMLCNELNKFAYVRCDTRGDRNFFSQKKICFVIKCKMKFIWEANNISLTSWLIQFTETYMY